MTLALPGVATLALPPLESRQAALSQWFTPAWLAAELVSLVDVRGKRVLEPSAGDGALVAACLAAGAESVLAFDFDPVMCERLRRRFTSRVSVMCGDFLSMHVEPIVDVVVGNPPYDKGADSAHLSRIADWMAAIGPQAEAALLLRTVALHSGERADDVWSRLVVRELVAVSDRVPFLAAGEDGDAGKIDVSLFRVGVRAPGERSAVRMVRAPHKRGKAAR